MASWLVRTTPDRPVWVRDLTGDIVLCFWVRHITLTVPLSTQVNKWVPADLMLGGGGGNPAMDQHPIQREVEILLAASCHRNRYKLRHDGPQLARICRLYFFTMSRIKPHIKKRSIRYVMESAYVRYLHASLLTYQKTRISDTKTMSV